MEQFIRAFEIRFDHHRFPPFHMKTKPAAIGEKHAKSMWQNKLLWYSIRAVNDVLQFIFDNGTLGAHRTTWSMVLWHIFKKVSEFNFDWKTTRQSEEKDKQTQNWSDYFKKGIIACYSLKLNWTSRIYLWLEETGNNECVLLNLIDLFHSGLLKTKTHVRCSWKKYDSL